MPVLPLKCSSFEALTQSPDIIAALIHGHKIPGYIRKPILEHLSPVSEAWSASTLAVIIYHNPQGSGIFDGIPSWPWMWPNLLKVQFLSLTFSLSKSSSLASYTNSELWYFPWCTKALNKATKWPSQGSTLDANQGHVVQPKELSNLVLYGVFWHFQHHQHIIHST